MDCCMQPSSKCNGMRTMTRRGGTSCCRLMTTVFCRSIDRNPKSMPLHSWLSPKCTIAASPLEGLGVFATELICEGELVCVWGGVVYSAAEIQAIGETFPHFRTHPFEVADGFFMGSTSLSAIDDAERFNHSCNPSVGVKGQIVVQARRTIAAGEELTFDYETTDRSPSPFECRCGAVDCRRTIDGSVWNSGAFQQRNRGWMSWYIQEMAGTD